jgi:hypothetical protein
MTFGRVSILVAIALVATGCSDVRESIIPSKRAPDEFAVYTRAPLHLPPEYNLRAPAPGTERPQAVSPRDVVEEAILGSSSRVTEADPTQNTSTGLQALLDNTGASSADPAIRAIINKETSILAEEDASVMERIMFWGMPTEYGSSVDPAEEKKRIQENQALGQPLKNGEVPTIAKKRKGILEGIFD